MNFTKVKKTYNYDHYSFSNFLLHNYMLGVKQTYVQRIKVSLFLYVYIKQMSNHKYKTYHD